MCGLFGFLNYKGNQSNQFLNTLCNSLAIESEIRGLDATGIAFAYEDEICVYKQAKRARKLKLELPRCIIAIIGHTRHTTHGSEQNNYNNHPFIGKIHNTSFAFAHNGVIHNYEKLRKDLQLSNTKIETDSYTAVQILETQENLSLQSHKYMAEQVQCSFTFSTLDQFNNLYITKGSSPISIINFKDIGLFVYASTEKILFNSIFNTTLFSHIKPGLSCNKCSNIEVIKLEEGDILKITSKGIMDKITYNVSNFDLDLDWYDYTNFDFNDEYKLNKWQIEGIEELCYEKEYMDEIIQVAISKGISKDDIVLLCEIGLYPDEIEELIYDPKLLNQYIKEFRNDI